MKKNGHYCKVCGRFRATEKFTGKGHATHICKDCAKLPPEVKAEQETLNRLSNLPWYLSKAQKDWLKNRTKDRRPEVKALAQEQYDMRFGRRHQEMQLDDSAVHTAEASGSWRGAERQWCGASGSSLI